MLLLLGTVVSLPFDLFAGILLLGVREFELGLVTGLVLGVVDVGREVPVEGVRSAGIAVVGRSVGLAVTGRLAGLEAGVILSRFIAAFLLIVEFGIAVTGVGRFPSEAIGVREGFLITLSLVVGVAGAALPGRLGVLGTSPAILPLPPTMAPPLGDPM